MPPRGRALRQLSVQLESVHALLLKCRSKGTAAIKDGRKDGMLPILRPVDAVRCTPLLVLPPFLGSVNEFWVVFELVDQCMKRPVSSKSADAMMIESSD
jgi:hypothetical protein